VAVPLRDTFWDQCGLVSSLLMIWTMGESALSANLWMIPACRGADDMPEGRAVIQRDQGRLEEWVPRSLTQLSEGK